MEKEKLTQDEINFLTDILNSVEMHGTREQVKNALLILESLLKKLTSNETDN